MTVNWRRTKSSLMSGADTPIFNVPSTFVNRAKKADMYSRLVWMVLLIVHMSRCTHGFMCEIAKAPPGLVYAGETGNIHGIAAGYSARFRCHDIYEDSLTRLTCVKDDTWSDPSPPCKWIKCAALPPVVDGSMEIRGWRVGDKVVISCREGFWYSGDTPQTCQRNRTWSGRDGQCQEVSCPSPDVLNDGNFHPQPPYKYKSRLKVICNPGFVYNGSQELVCLSNNTWDGVEGSCLDIKAIRCQPVQPWGNAAVTPLREDYNYKNTIHITCPKGFTYNGTRRRTCQVDGSWSGHEGSCHVKTCPPYIPVGVGWVEPACSPCEYRDTVRVVCPQGYNYNGTELTCNEHGTWEGTKGTCTGAPCVDDVGLAHGGINGSGFVYQNVVNITCDAGYRWEGASNLAVCDSHGNWTFNGSCIALKMEFWSNTPSTPRTGIIVAITVPLLALLVIIVVAGLSYKRFHHRNHKKQPTEDDLEQSRPLRANSMEMKSDNGDVMRNTSIRSQRVQNRKKPGLRETIISYGHVTNRDKDKKIDLDTQFITLRLVSGGDSYDMNDMRPDRYQDYLQKARGENIEVTDLLKYVKYDEIPAKVGTAINEVTYTSCFKGVTQRGDGTKYMKKSRPLLLEGRGGVGKSTLVQKLMRLWAQNKWAKDYKAAFLFNIRSLAVVDKRHVSLENFFKRFSVYIQTDETTCITASSLKEDKIIIFIDGVDEFPSLAEKLGKERNVETDGEAEPISWCVNILRRHVLQESLLILASRPFRDLAAVKCEPVLEVVGLTRDAILQFINCHVGRDKSEEEKAATIERVKKTMTGNKLVMSVSAITYFCMLFCQVLEKNENVSMEELTTYTRIAAFFMQDYMSRCPANLDVEPSSILPPLAGLAYNGLVENRVNDGIARLVFDEKDCEALKLNDIEMKISCKCGILVAHDLPDAHSTYEFVHLSVQELLAMMELSQKDSDTLIEKVNMMLKSSSFNMAKMYLYGLLFDEKSSHIKKLMASRTEILAGSNTKEALQMAIIEYKSGTSFKSEEVLQSVQMAYETQNEEMVKHVSSVLFKNTETMELSRTQLTAIDMNAIIFIIKEACNVTKLRLENISMDRLCVEILVDFLRQDSSLTELGLRDTIKEEDSIWLLVETIVTHTTLTSVDLRGVGLSDDTIEAVMKALLPNKTLQLMWLTGSGGDTNTLVCEPGTGRRVRVLAGLSTFIHAWTPADITPSIISHDGVVWGGGQLCLYLNDKFSSIYGEDRPAVSPDVWSQLLDGVTQCKHRVRRLEVWLSSSSPLTPLLTSITSHWGALIHKQVERVEVCYGEVTCCDLHTWYTSLTTQPGWSVRRGRYDEYAGRAEGAKITNTHGQSVVILLRWTRITSSHQDHRHSLEQAPGLLYNPEWV